MRLQLRHLPTLLTGAAVALVILPMAVGCASSDPVGEDGTGGKPGAGPEGNDEPAICLLHNCTSDDHCGGCDEGRTTCKLDEGRCVACDAATATGCADGEYCTSWGNCAPNGVTCPTDDHGTPQIGCQQNSDCIACDPMHQVCSPEGLCVACTASDTSECASNDVCINDKCEDECPLECETDNDCGLCGVGEGAAHACHGHKCAECSATYACPAGLVCSANGTCIQECGEHDDGVCQSDADCQGCGATASVCHKPINGGAGQCGPAASGCSDLGESAAVLPAPFDQVTNLCSNDNDCAGVGVDLNVGKMIRDLTGISSIDDAVVSYPMAACADVSVGSLSCGVCVPCEVDSDCQDIDIDQVALDAFGPIGSLASAFLLDQVFGDNDHTIHMYCESVAGGYGVCSPCPGFLYDCSVGGGGGSGGGTGTCSHSTCTTGAALNSSCDSCSQTVCDIDPFCCNNEWDALCVSQAEDWCGISCGSGGSACSHSECTAGSKLTATCSSCATTVCNADPFCCNTEWDDICVQQAQASCGITCGGGGGAPACAHPECSAGAALSSTCSSCASQICAQDSYCCDTNWDSICIGLAETTCGLNCGGGGSSCIHDECAAGAQLSSSCSTCATDVCDYDPYCCNTNWDATCVSHADYFCGC